jgi:cytochrome c oxidase assembly protein subunit 11
MSGPPNRHRQLALQLAAMALGSFAFGYALVPLYAVLCDITGIGSSRATAVAASQPDLSRSVTVEFVASVPAGSQWAFQPHVTSMQVHPGKLYQTTFYARNLAGRAVVGQAVPSVSPARAAQHFQKTECFCFTPQRFAADEARDMPSASSSIATCRRASTA